LPFLFLLFYPLPATFKNATSSASSLRGSNFLFFTFARSFLKKKICFFLTFAPRGPYTRAPEGRTQARVQKNKKCYLCKQRGSKSKIFFSASSRQLPLVLPLRGNFYSYFALARSRATARENKQNNQNEARAKVKSLYLFEVAGAKE
jgi:hypothetical protein